MYNSKTLTENLRVNVTPAQLDALKRLAEQEERSLAAIVRRAIREFLEREDEA